MSHSIHVHTGARLHFGLLAVNAPADRNFGGVGLMVDGPGCELSVTSADHDQIVATEELTPRLAAWRTNYREHCPAEHIPPPCCIEVRQAIPTHAGLGSGTQTALALAAALARLGGENDLAAPELARRVGRGLRSALGIHGFQHGGFLVEAGKRDVEEISPLVARLTFPAEWRLLLITPRDHRGLSGDSERTAFARLGPMLPATTDRLCRLVLMDLLPSIAARDFETVSAALFEFGRLNGEYFAPVQGGLFADPRMAELAEWLSAQDCRGVGQSSWGSTLFALCPNEAEATERQRALLHRTKSVPIDCQLARPRNCGATRTA